MKGSGSNGDDEEDEERSGVGTSMSRPSVSSSIHVAHIGNSIQYYNDCPRLLEQMLRSTIAANLTADNGLEESSIEDVLDILVEQDSCLKGGVNLSSLWFDGNGMDQKFASRPASRTTTTTQSAAPSSSSSSSSSSSENKEEYDIGASTVRQLLLNKNGRFGKRNRKNQTKNRNTTSTSTTATTTTTTTHKFWDYIVINDHTQWPVRPETKKQSISILLNEYVPTIIEGMHQSSSSSAVSAASAVSSSSSKTDSTTITVLFVQTPAYKVPGILNSHDLGTFQEYTQQLREGYQDYVTAVHNYVQENSKALPRDAELVPLLVPFGRAYKMIHDDEAHSSTPCTTTTNTMMWQTRLYAKDNYHPSPHGTFLLACLLHCYVTEGIPFTMIRTNGGERYGYDPATWWTTARYMQPTTATTLTDDPQDTNNNNKDDESLPLPTIEEALYLNDIAYRVYCQQQ